MRKIQLIQYTPAWGRNWGLALYTDGPTVTSILFLGHGKAFSNGNVLFILFKRRRGVKQSLTASPVKQQQLCEGLALSAHGQTLADSCGVNTWGNPCFPA